MRRNSASLCALATALLSFSLAPAGGWSAQTPLDPSAAPLQGRWITESGNLEVEIAPCGEALCGTVARVLGNRSMSGAAAPLVQADAQPILGRKILTDFTPVGDGEWRGEIYNRENGKTYRCILASLPGDQLKVRGYVGLPLFGKTQVWRRAAASAQ